MNVTDFGYRDERFDMPPCVFETNEERIRRLKIERLQEEVEEEKKMLSGNIPMDENLLLNRIEHFIYDSYYCYYALCSYALLERPAWMPVIRKNTVHLTALIEAYTKWRQHKHNVLGEQGTEARRDVTYDRPVDF